MLCNTDNFVHHLELSLIPCLTISWALSPSTLFLETVLSSSPLELKFSIEIIK